MVTPRILLIDDDEGLSELFLLFMPKKGFRAAAAGDGEAGLAKLPIFRPHLIVLDIMMPKLNGFEVLHRLPGTEFANIPVILMTGYSDPSNQEIARKEPNVVDFLQKPVEYEALAQRIKAVLADRKLEE
jgi:DNA-binding response OmpR family regulator